MLHVRLSCVVTYIIDNMLHVRLSCVVAYIIDNMLHVRLSCVVTYIIDNMLQVGRQLTDELLGNKDEFGKELERVIALEQDLQKAFAVTLDIRYYIKFIYIYMMVNIFG